MSVFKTVKNTNEVAVTTFLLNTWARLDLDRQAGKITADKQVQEFSARMRTVGMDLIRHMNNDPFSFEKIIDAEVEIAAFVEPEAKIILALSAALDELG